MYLKVVAGGWRRFLLVVVGAVRQQKCVVPPLIGVMVVSPTNPGEGEIRSRVPAATGRWLKRHKNDEYKKSKRRGRKEEEEGANARENGGGGRMYTEEEQWPQNPEGGTGYPRGGGCVFSVAFFSDGRTERRRTDESVSIPSFPSLPEECMSIGWGRKSLAKLWGREKKHIKLACLWERVKSSRSMGEVGKLVSIRGGT